MWEPWGRVEPWGWVVEPWWGSGTLEGKLNPGRHRTLEGMQEPQDWGTMELGGTESTWALHLVWGCGTMPRHSGRPAQAPVPV